MKVDYDELLGFRREAMNTLSRDREDAIESILDAVPDIVREHKEAENKIEQLEMELSCLRAELENQRNAAMGISFTKEYS